MKKEIKVNHMPSFEEIKRSMVNSVPPSWEQKDGETDGMDDMVASVKDNVCSSKSGQNVIVICIISFIVFAIGIGAGITFRTPPNKVDELLLKKIDQRAVMFQDDIRFGSGTAESIAIIEKEEKHIEFLFSQREKNWENMDTIDKEIKKIIDDKISGKVK